MAMTNEDIERTGIYKIISDKSDSSTEVIISVDEIKEKLEYMDIEESKKQKYLDLIDEIKKEKNEKTREFLFKQLINIINKEG